MMHPRPRVFISIAVIAAGWWSLAGHGMIIPTADATEEMVTAYTPYVAQSSQFNPQFEYPSEWRVMEERGTIDPYDQVRILGPRNSDDTFTLLMAIRRQPLKEQGGRYSRAEELAQEYIDRLGKEGIVEAHTSKPVAEVAAVDLTISYLIPPMHTPRLKPLTIPVKMRGLFFVKSSSVYEVTYSADAGMYDQYAPAFEHVVATLRLP